MKKQMKRRMHAQGAQTQTQPGQQKAPDAILAFVAKGPAQQAYSDMLGTLLGAPAKSMGHFSIPARGTSPYSTAYAFQGYMDEAAAFEAKLAASPIAEHFDAELIQCSDEERGKAEQSTSTGQLPVITVAQ